MHARTLLAAALLAATVVLSSCTDPTGPSETNYVHVLVANGSAAPIYVPAVRSTTIGQKFDISTEQLLPGAVAEVVFIRPDSAGGGLAVYEATELPSRLLGTVNFVFVRMPARAAGRDTATIRIVVAGGAVTASTDRTDLVTITGVTNP